MSKAIIIDTIPPKSKVVVFNTNLDRLMFYSAENGRIRIELDFGDYYFTYQDKKVNVTLDRPRYTLKDIFNG